MSRRSSWSSWSSTSSLSSSVSSGESYTTNLLASIKQQQEHFDRTISLWELLNKDTSSFSADFGRDQHTLAHRRQKKPPAPLNLAPARRGYQYQSEPPMVCPSCLLVTQPWTAHPRIVSEEPRGKWQNSFKDVWYDIMICLGFKSVSGPD